MRALPGAFRDLALTLRASLHKASGRLSGAPPVAYLATTVRDAASQAAFISMLEGLQLKATALQCKGCSPSFRHLLALRQGPAIVCHTIAAA